MTEPDDNQPTKPAQRTISNLRLNLQEAINGRSWLLLPEGFRDQESGQKYPLPTKTEELQKLVILPIKPGKKDSGTLYLKRAQREYRRRLAGKHARIAEASYEGDRLAKMRQHLHDQIVGIRKEARDAVDGIKEEAEKAVASMHELFALGRKGIDGQMRAHLEGSRWKGEGIDAKAFRECFRLVTQTVKGLGLPERDEAKKAREAILEEAEASIRSVQEAVALSEMEDDGKEH